MKLLILIIAVILMSVFSESIYAQGKTIEGKQMRVVGFIDESLVKMRQQREEIQAIRKNQAEKNKLQSKMNDDLRALIPGQLIMEKDQKQFNKMIEVRDQYLECFRNGTEEDCAELKAQLDSLTDSSTSDESLSMETYITNRPELEKIRSCLNVAREVYPDFKARITIKMNVDQAGFPISSHVVEESSMMSPYFANFPQCVAQFSKDLKYKNTHEDFAEVTQTFIF